VAEYHLEFSKFFNKARPGTKVGDHGQWPRPILTILGL